jgi:hypothetical protein
MNVFIHYISALIFISFVLYSKLNKSLFLIQIFSDDTFICKDIDNNKVINFDFNLHTNKTLIKYKYKDKYYTNFNNNVFTLVEFNDTELGFKFYISFIYFSFIFLVFLDYILNKKLSHLQYSFNIFANEKNNFILLKYLAPFFVLYYKILFLDLESKNITLLTCIIYIFWFSHYLFIDILKNSFISSFFFEFFSILLSVETIKLNDSTLCSFYNDNIIFLSIFIFTSVIISKIDLLLKNGYTIYKDITTKNKSLMEIKYDKNQLRVDNYFYVKVFLKLSLVVFFIIYFKDDFIFVSYIVNQVIYYYIYFYTYKHIKFEQNKQDNINHMRLVFND